MSLGTKNPNSLTSQLMQPLVLNDDNDMEVFDFSTLRDELDVDHSDEVDEQEHDDTYEYEEASDSLGFEFATDIDNVTSATFEEEAFGVKKVGLPMNEGKFKQSQPNIWNKDPFTGQSQGMTSPKVGENGKTRNTGNQIKTITRRANLNPPPISREISAGISFASILSGKATQEQDDNDSNTPTSATAISTNSASSKTPQTAPPVSPDSNSSSSPATLIPQETKVPTTDEHMHQPVTDSAQPAVYNVTDIEANMGQQQQQQRPSNKNLLYQLLPGLSQQQHPQHQPSKQGPVDINSFFQKHHERQQQKQSSASPAILTEMIKQQQQPQVDINSFFQKHHQQQARSVSYANNAIHQHTPTTTTNTTIHKPNMTTEQELKQKEDDGKDSYDGLMTAKNVQYIDQIERSKLADSNQHSTGDFYYHMYTVNHGGQQQQAPPMMNQVPNTNNGLIYQQEQGGDSGKGYRVTLDKVLGDIIKEHDSHKDDPSQDDKKHSKNDHQQLLKTIESIYFLILQVEQSYREMNGTMPSLHNSTPQTSMARQETMSKIWDTLAMDQSPHTVISILKVNKGMSLIGRLVPYLNDSQRQILMTTIAYYFVDILPSPPMNVDTQGPRHQQRQSIDYIHPSISGCLEHILYGASLSYISQILSSVSNHSDFKLLIGTTTGHRFLGTLLFHAKGKQQHQQQEESDNEQWMMTYGSYFDKVMESSSHIKNMAHLDNLAVWMLLNSMAVCCNPQQKDRMALTYRETVSMTMKTISDLERNHVPVPYPIQASYPVVKELWSSLCLTDESFDQNDRS